MVRDPWPDDLADTDARLVVAVDAELERGARAAGKHLACRLGCTSCCIGPFEITALDAERLRAGLEALRAHDPERAAAIARRAAAAWEVLREDVPGDPVSGGLGENEAARQAFFSRFARVPCPVLDPASGECELYASRPLSCRTYGPPVRCDGEVLPPCELCFTNAAPEDVVRAIVVPDPEDVEGSLLAALGQAGRTGRDTVVAAALAAQEDEVSS